ncbi:ShlB/FhaC/HecB family hemolysin secretion/activation protein [Neptunicella marina]|uniref:Haemolysin activator HlyB C-terminal domain-containing protein n=1 Tax=Neptunicella marina TaxID=2125989 RepID=A0A8J6IW38_9ALTE|nr:ShlB/FhaC/HecB family hemolysin secretion/activation protein [Neptunicella marina]MBC3767209.1 hypothetical protein [Neptunicella marina]
MKHKLNPKSFILNPYLLAGCALWQAWQPVSAADSCDTPAETVLTINPIFDIYDPETTWLHRFANKLHIETQPSTLRNELAYFDLCDTSDTKLAELERYLRQRRYIREAKVSKDADGKINIETWDNWTLMPEISFGRKGGKNQFSMGLKDRNVLGLGIDMDVSYYDDIQSSGYKFVSRFPLFLGYNATGSIELQDNDDGQVIKYAIDRPFISFETDWAAHMLSQHEKSIYNLYQNVDDEILFARHYEQTSAQYGWLGYRYEHAALRYWVGYFHQQQLFDPLPDQPLPADRQLSYPWFGVDYVEDGYQELQDIHLIGNIEDINLGWSWKSRFGYSPPNSYSDGTWIFKQSISKGVQLADKILMLASTDWNMEFSQRNSLRYHGSLETELFYRYADKWAWYNRIFTELSHRAYIDEPVTIGGDTRLRGYPIQYSHGERSVLMTNEIRYYPKINLYQIFELGAVAFMDVARISGDVSANNMDHGWLSSVGVGLRLYSSHSSDKQVLHLDFAHPMSSGADLSSIEIRMEVKQSF